MSLTLLEGDCRAMLPTLPAESVQCVVTSPPYWGLRDYGTASWEGGDPACRHLNGQLVSDKSTLRLDGRAHVGPYDGEKGVTAGMPYRERCGRCGARRVDQQIGLEATPEDYLATMVGVLRDVRRVLRPDGTLWLNMGDGYAAQGGGGESRMRELYPDERDRWRGIHTAAGHGQISGGGGKAFAGFKTKDLIGMPWRLALALQADGWYLRADIIWAKPNPMPESVTDRPTKAHEYVFLLTKSARYYYDADAVREPVSASTLTDQRIGTERPFTDRSEDYGVGTSASRRYGRNAVGDTAGRNLRSVWTIATAPYPEAHFATFPPELARRCIVAGSRMGDTVLDPFAGSGTVGEVAEQNGRDAILIELSPTYIELARARTAQMGLFASFEDR